MYSESYTFFNFTGKSIKTLTETKRFQKIQQVDKIHQEALEKTLLKAILEITFREGNPIEKIDDVIATLTKEMELG